MTDILAELKAAAAKKWKGDPACQQAGLFARAAAEIERLRDHAVILAATAEQVERQRLLNALRRMHTEAKGAHNYYLFAVRQLELGTNVGIEPPRSGRLE